MSVVIATQTEPQQFICTICDRDLTNAAHVLNCSFEYIKNVHEDAHRLEALRELRSISRHILENTDCLKVLYVGEAERLKKAIDVLDRLC